MPGEPQGLMYFPGVKQIVECTVSFYHGIAPGVIVITMAPQENFIGEAGTLILTFAGTRIVFPNCKVDRASFERTAAGLIWRLSLFDRRWKWRDKNGGGQISGTYNVWRDDFSLRKGQTVQGTTEKTIDTEKSPQALAKLCLKAMGEKKYEVDALPNDPRPSVEWDYTNPAEALQDLCEQLGCRVTIRLRDDAVVIVKVGDGKQLPEGLMLDNSLTIDPPEMPEKIAIVCGPTLYQVDFFLEAVGIDTPLAPGFTQDILAPIDKLSYKPPGGWTDIVYFLNVGKDVNGRDVTGLRALAVKSVFRYYRIRMPVRIPGYDGPEKGLVRFREQILPIDDQQLVTGIENASFERTPAWVFGVWYPQLGKLGNTQARLTPLGGIVPRNPQPDFVITPFYSGGFSVDASRGLVIFDEPVYRNDVATLTPSNSTFTIKPAYLILRCSCHVRDEKTLAPKRHTRTRSTGVAGKAGTGTRYIMHEEIVRTYIPTYDAASYASITSTTADDPRKVSSLKQNVDKVDKECDHYIEAALREYETSTPQQITYPGLRLVELDGAIYHVVYTVGVNGATTIAARNSELLNYTISYKDRRRIEQTKAAVDKSKQPTAVQIRAAKRSRERKERLA